jgi:hypothetical protein
MKELTDYAAGMSILLALKRYLVEQYKVDTA